MKNIKKKVFRMLLGIMCVMQNCCMTVFATTEAGTGAEEAAKTVVQPIYVVLNIFIVALQAIGVFIFVKGVSELSTAIKQQDDSGAASAAKGLVSGLLLIFIKKILEVCGITF